MTGDRRGFTLIELIVVAVLGSLVLGAVLQVLITNQRTYTAQTATVSGQQSTRMALDVLFNELREASASGDDLIGMGRDSLRLRLMRKFGVTCSTGIASLQLTVLRETNIFNMVGSNMFEVGDSVFVYADNNGNTEDDDVWIPATITAVDTAGVTCPQDGAPAATLTFLGQAAAFAADSVGIGAPIRSFKTYTFGDTILYGDVYFARREGSGPMIPVAGPLKATDGLDFTYRDAFGTVTAVDTDVRQIEVLVRTGSNVLDSRGEVVSDSITAWIYTRN